jgi:hypothetical protein
VKPFASVFRQLWATEDEDGSILALASPVHSLTHELIGEHAKVKVKEEYPRTPNEARGQFFGANGRLLENCLATRHNEPPVIFRN